MTIRQLILNADNAAGRFFNLKLPAYIREKNLTTEGDAYTSAEWTKTRELGYRNAGLNSSELDNDRKYLDRIFQTQYRNVLSAQRLCRLIDFGQYNSVLELGCGEMVQAFVITQLFPGIRYCATDFDPYIIRKCSSLPLLSNIQKKELDVSKINSHDLNGFQLVVSWEMIYALDEGTLSQLFGAVSESGVDMLVATTQLTGPFRAFARRFKGLPFRDKNLGREGVRMHGWNHSVGHYQQLAKKFNLVLKGVWYPSFRIWTQDNFTFLHFVVS